MKREIDVKSLRAVCAVGDFFEIEHFTHPIIGLNGRDGYWAVMSNYALGFKAIEAFLGDHYILQYLVGSRDGTPSLRCSINEPLWMLHPCWRIMRHNLVTSLALFGAPKRVNVKARLGQLRDSPRDVRPVLQKAKDALSSSSFSRGRDWSDDLVADMRWSVITVRTSKGIDSAPWPRECMLLSCGNDYAVLSDKLPSTGKEVWNCRNGTVWQYDFPIPFPTSDILHDAVAKNIVMSKASQNVFESESVVSEREPNSPKEPGDDQKFTVPDSPSEGDDP